MCPNRLAFILFERFRRSAMKFKNIIEFLSEIYHKFLNTYKLDFFFCVNKTRDVEFAIVSKYVLRVGPMFIHHQRGRVLFSNEGNDDLVIWTSPLSAN